MLGFGQRIAQQIVRGQPRIYVLGGLLGAGDEHHVVARDPLDDAGEQRVVGTSEHERVDAGLPQREQILLSDAQQPGPPVMPASTNSTKRGQACMNNSIPGAAAKASS